MDAHLEMKNDLRNTSVLLHRSHQILIPTENEKLSNTHETDRTSNTD